MERKVREDFKVFRVVDRGKRSETREAEERREARLEKREESSI